MVNKLLTKDILNESAVLIDTNIWQYLYGVQASNDDHGYSNVYGELIENDIGIYVNPQIISEFVNLNVRLAYKQQLKNEHLTSDEYSFKFDFQTTQEFRIYYDSAIGVFQEEILKIAKLTKPNNTKVINSLNNYNLLDFNDEIILQDAISNNLPILTHDKDYLAYPGDINIYRAFWPTDKRS